MAGLQPRFGVGSRRAKAWVSNELAVIDGVPRLSGLESPHLQPLGCGPRLHTVQHSTAAHRQANRTSLKCHHSRVASLPVLLHCMDGLLRLPPPSWNLVNVSSHATARDAAPRIIIAQDDAPGPTILSRSVAKHDWPNCYLKVEPLVLPGGCLLACLLAWIPRLGTTTQLLTKILTWVLPTDSSQGGGCRLPLPSRAHPCPTRFLSRSVSRPLRHSRTGNYRKTP